MHDGCVHIAAAAIEEAVGGSRVSGERFHDLVGAIEMVGAAGLEPAIGGFKGRCLTIWLRPRTPLVGFLIYTRCL